MSVGSELPDDATFFIETSTNLVHWSRVTTNSFYFSFPLSEQTNGPHTRFFRFALP